MISSQYFPRFMSIRS